MDIVSQIRQKAKEKRKKIILPEYDDWRVVEAAKIIEKEKLAEVLLLTPDKINLKDRERYIQEFYQGLNSKSLELGAVEQLFSSPLYCAAMMVRDGKFDGLVAGANHTTPDVARAVIHCIGVDERATIVSSCFIMVVPDCAFGENGTFVFSDCGIIPEPNPRQLAHIAWEAALLIKKVLDFTPRIALLSYSTKGSAKGRSVDKVAEALSMLKELAPDLLVDGEMQVDAAIVPEVAKIKYPDSPIAGKANVLIFPSLEAGNISYKLVERLAKARAIGPLLLGLNKPASDLSRGCSVEDIVDCVAATAIRAQ